MWSFGVGALDLTAGYADGVRHSAVLADGETPADPDGTTWPAPPVTPTGTTWPVAPVTPTGTTWPVAPGPGGNA
ncbi:hypothetical protein [Streptosporangium sp. KLBMP 9127]|nr:hypothetical protein [Streptosporangium sp. KLBMP 9127]